ncbi:hypothetical protein HPB47_009972 [Ixodes persulcatus]|uniref:Uncharacterized protein n=1 Tax=Ixodes persulcatus TaxID=34615 RepID=A0AC60P0P2_IXOPE|nr:hypothetical protein HPB47_009972 [Ixodes persulcatus]
MLIALCKHVIKWSRTGLLKLQHLFQLTTDRYHLEVRVVRRVRNASDVNGYLRRMEDRDRESRKYVVLDCTAETTREIIINHVRDPFMGRRNYHFLLTSLVSVSERAAIEVYPLSFQPEPIRARRSNVTATPALVADEHALLKGPLTHSRLLRTEFLLSPATKKHAGTVAPSMR